MGTVDLKLARKIQGCARATVIDEGRSRHASAEKQNAGHFLWEPNTVTNATLR